MMWLSWIDALPRVLFGYKQNGWIVLLIMLSWDVWQIRKERRWPVPVDGGKTNAE